MRRIRMSFWGLVVVAVLSTGVLERALGARAGPATGIAVAASATVLATALALALRILVVVNREGH